MTSLERLSPSEIAQARQRRVEAIRLQEVEGNPFSADQVGMFEMFDREGWSHDHCLAYILAKHQAAAAE